MTPRAESHRVAERTADMLAVASLVLHDGCSVTEGDGARRRRRRRRNRWGLADVVARLLPYTDGTKGLRALPGPVTVEPQPSR